MMPIHPGSYVSYAFAVLTGFAFGFVLERAGFGSSRKLAAQFYLRDMTVLKVMFSAIVTAMLGLTLLSALGLLDFDALYVNPTYLAPQVVGGLVFGIGFVIGGYCPGTCVVATVTGKLDALVFLVGVGLGAIGFAGVYPRIAAFAQSGGGERWLLSDWLQLSRGAVAVLVTLLALAMFAGAELVERTMRRHDEAKHAPPRDEPTLGGDQAPHPAE
jgi:uncharacterized protein